MHFRCRLAFLCASNAGAITIIITTKKKEEWTEKKLLEYRHCVALLLLLLIFASQAITRCTVCACVRVCVYVDNVVSEITAQHAQSWTQTVVKTAGEKRKKKVIENCVAWQKETGSRNRKLWQLVYVNYLFYHPPKPKGVGISIFKRWNRNDNNNQKRMRKIRNKHQTKSHTTVKRVAAWIRLPNCEYR